LGKPSGIPRTDEGFEIRLLRLPLQQQKYENFHNNRIRVYFALVGFPAKK
jgi:hypothetical protein